MKIFTKGPAMRPSEASVAKFEETISGLAKTAGNFFKKLGALCPENLCGHKI